MTWVDVRLAGDPRVSIGLELGLSLRLLPWADGRRPATAFERWYMATDREASCS